MFVTREVSFVGNRSKRPVIGDGVDQLSISSANSSLEILPSFPGREIRSRDCFARDALVSLRESRRNRDSQRVSNDFTFQSFASQLSITQFYFSPLHRGTFRVFLSRFFFRERKKWIDPQRREHRLDV